MDERTALRNVVGRIEMVKVADEEDDRESSNQHLLMAVNSLGEMVCGLMSKSGRASECLVGVRAVVLLGAVACESDRRARLRLLLDAEHLLGKLKAWLDPPPVLPATAAWNDMALHLAS